MARKFWTLLVMVLLTLGIAQYYGCNGGSDSTPEDTPPTEDPPGDDPPGDDPPATPATPAHQASAWTYLGGPSGGLGYDIRMQPDNPDIMFVTDAFAGAFKSTDSGATWSAVNTGITSRATTAGDAIPVFCLTIDPNDNTIVWLGTQHNGGIFKSTDTGETWTDMNTGNNGIQEEFLSIRGLTIEPGNSDVIYFAAEVPSVQWNNGESITGTGLDMTMGVVYRSVDGGANWTRLWYGDNLTRYIIIHPDDTNTLYVSTGIFDREAANSDIDTLTVGGVGILRSTDRGQTWEILDENHGLDSDKLYFSSIFMDPSDPDTIVAASDNDPYTWIVDRVLGGIFRTTDGGDTWTEVFSSYGLSTIEICEGDPNIVYAAGKNGFLKSEDNGLTWTELGGANWGPPGLIAGFSIDMQCDPRDSQRLFVNNYNGGNFLTTDGGTTWQSASKGYSGALMKQIALSPDDVKHIYASCRAGIYSSTDGGVTWTGLSNGEAREQEAEVIAVNPFDTQHIIARVGDAGPTPLYSEDGGQTWDRVVDIIWNKGDEDLEPENITRFIFSPTTEDLVFATLGPNECDAGEECVGYGIISSENGGTAWGSTGMTTGIVKGIGFDPQNAGTFWVALYDGKLYKTTDSGTTFTLVNTNITPATGAPPDDPNVEISQFPTALAVDPSDADTLYAGFNSAGMYTSTDAGLTWSNISVGLPSGINITDLIVDPDNAGVIYVSSADRGIYYSTNSGLTWTELNTSLTNREIIDIALSHDGSVLYAGSTGAGVHRLGAVE